LDNNYKRIKGLRDYI